MTTELFATSHRSGFTDVDRSLEAAALVHYLEALGETPFVRSYVARSVAELRLKDGDTLLDIGCGIAHDLRDLLSGVGPSGKVILLDASEKMIAEAERKWNGVVSPEAVEFWIGDARHLGGLARVDGARIVRTLMHIENPGVVIAEMARVVRPGGRIVAFEPDWKSVEISTSDLQTSRLLLGLIEQRIASPGVGRMLGGLFESAGIREEVAVTPFPYRMERLAEAEDCFRLTKLLRELVSSGKISSKREGEFLAELCRREREGVFSASINCYLIAGTTPA